MHKEELDVWWASLTIAQKERIARKGLAKASPDGVADESQVLYPGCSRWWNSLDTAHQAKIHDHCIDRHGYLQQEWNEADPYGD